MRENGDEASVSPSVGEFIRKLRQLADLSLRQMAELAHVSTPISARSSVDSTSRRSRASVDRRRPRHFRGDPARPDRVLHPTHGAPDTATATDVLDTETAIPNDPHLTPDDRDAFTRIYRSLRKPPSD
jgi:hypothetical protein